MALTGLIKSNVIIMEEWYEKRFKEHSLNRTLLLQDYQREMVTLEVSIMTKASITDH